MAHASSPSASGETDAERLPEEMRTVTELSFDAISIDEAKFLGKGAFSSVYEGELTVPGAEPFPVAIKKMRIPAAVSKDHKYLQTELRLLSGLAHRNLVKYFGLAKDETHAYIVTELMRGGDLRAVLEGAASSEDPEAAFPTGLRLRVARDIAAGIDYMHINEIVHRDIKTENVLLDEGWRPVLADYGFARKVTSKRNMTIVGTDEFMAPEVIWGESYDERADVFSFGVVLAEMMSWRRAGEAGFMARTPRGQFRLDEEQVTAAVRAGAPRAPGRLAELVMQCLAYEADDRVDSGEALSTLEEILEEWAEAEAGEGGEGAAGAAAAGPGRRPSEVAAAGRAKADVARAERTAAKAAEPEEADGDDTAAAEE